MGNCRSVPQKEEEKVSPSKLASISSQESPQDEASTAGLIHALLPLVLPIIRQVISQQWINDKLVLKDEVLLEELDENDMPFGLMELHMEHVRVLNLATLVKDVEQMPEFDWPETERLRELMKFVPGVGRGMVAMDLIGVKFRLQFGSSIELVFPVEGPMGTTANLEVGVGGTIQEAWFQVEIPKLRVWFVNDTRQLYVALLARPSVLPHLHVNVDRGKGDFFEMEFTQAGAMDDVAESVLCGFGPSSITQKVEKEENGKSAKTSSKQNKSWVGNALGRRISQAVGTFAGVGNNRPMEVDLKETIQSSIDSALGKPRPIEAINADMDVLKKELATAEKAMNKTEEGKKHENARAAAADSSRKSSPSSMLCCGLGS